MGHFIVIISVVLILFFFILFRDLKKPFNFPPGPKWWPVIGSLLTIQWKRSRLGYHHLVWHDLSKQYGPVVGLRLGRDLIVIVSSVDGIRQVFTRDDFDGRPDGFFFRMRTFGKRLGLVFTEGHLWQKQRKFSLHHLKQFGYGRREMEEQITKEVQVLIQNLRERSAQPVQMHHLFDISVINVLWAMMAGERFELEDYRLKQLLAILHDAFRSTDISGGLLNQMPFLRFIIPEKCGYKSAALILNRMWEFLGETISQHKQSLCSSHTRDLIDAFLLKMQIQNSNTNIDNTFTDEQLMSLCLDLFMAGSETASNTLEFIVLYMVKYPEIQKQIQEEMDEVVGRNRWPTLQDRNKLHYVDAVINEVQRICNVAPVGIAHRAIRATHLLGYEIPEGTTILTNLYSIHMDESFWLDPHAFRPERFLDTEKKRLCQDTYFAPFGYGRRRCLGESLAKANLFLVSTALFHNFAVTALKEEPPLCVRGVDGVTLSPKPYNVQLIPRY